MTWFPVCAVDSGNDYSGNDDDDDSDVVSINRLVGEGGEFPWLGRKQHCCARLDGPLL